MQYGKESYRLTAIILLFDCRTSSNRLTRRAFECNLDNGVAFKVFLGVTALKCKAEYDFDWMCMKEPAGEFGFTGNLEFEKGKC